MKLLGFKRARAQGRRLYGKSRGEEEMCENDEDAKGNEGETDFF